MTLPFKQVRRIDAYAYAQNRIRPVGDWQGPEVLGDLTVNRILIREDDTRGWEPANGVIEIRYARELRFALFLVEMEPPTQSRPSA